MASVLVTKNKDRFYRGENVENLKNLNTREFAKLVKSRARRSLLRNYDVIEAFVRRCEDKTVKNKVIKTHHRSLVVVPQLIGKTIGVYNGKEFIKVIITDEMLGHRLGEFSMTRKIARHTKAGVGATKSTVSKAK
ncbi:ribosomal protein S19 family protein [Candidatus Pacearchaeota archaeon]|nr:ribosomal protein S19 family protein [Candidatus Pacearchaeota archaeon]